MLDEDVTEKLKSYVLWRTGKLGEGDGGIWEKGLTV